MQKPTKKEWTAITDCDANFDGVFYYAVQTTGIFCRPSCKSKAPNYENVVIFKSSGAAIKAGFRPCKRCKSGGERVPDAEWVMDIKRFVASNLAEPLSLEQIAAACHGSESHLHRTFKKVTGETIHHYVIRKKLILAQEMLRKENLEIKQIARAVGFNNAAQFATLFKKQMGMTPSKYRNEVLK
ncbi:MULTISPECIES: bifunctional transcriptional activator/DNA repair enzyme AdaA [unclassified Listeria]|uniref:bifunctional transcriptional activator/DNA repair enzyme AdaA n=1 Tax=unclassified Listeria TaxID=2642072 RepID=UPI000B58FDD8|nr:MULTISPECIES: Ada metal-binding domain-containing protein [unclassified Listeria]